MRQLITNPKRFADWFNKEVPYAYRQMTLEDIVKLASERLIRKSGGYFQLNADKLTIIGILNYLKYLDEKLHFSTLCNLRDFLEWLLFC